MEKHEITNNFRLDAIKDNFTPPSMEEMSEDSIRELFNRLDIDFAVFEKHVYDNSEYYTDKGKKLYLVKDVAKIISKELHPATT